MYSATKDHLHGVAQAGVPVHLWVHSWATQVLLTQLFAQVIPGLRSLTGLGPAAQPRNAWVPQQATPAGTVQCTPIPPKGMVLVLTREWPVNQIEQEGMANQPIFLSNDTDSGLESLGQSTPVKVPSTK